MLLFPLCAPRPFFAKAARSGFYSLGAALAMPFSFNSVIPA